MLRSKIRRMFGRRCRAPRMWPRLGESRPIIKTLLGAVDTRAFLGAGVRPGRRACQSCPHSLEHVPVVDAPAERAPEPFFEIDRRRVPEFPLGLGDRAHDAR